MQTHSRNSEIYGLFKAETTIQVNIKKFKPWFDKKEKNEPSLNDRIVKIKNIFSLQKNVQFLPQFYLLKSNFIVLKNVMQGKLIAVAYTLRTY